MNKVEKKKAIVKFPKEEIFGSKKKLLSMLKLLAYIRVS